MLIKDFKSLLADPNISEPSIQEFLETHTVLLPEPWLLNHGVHLSCFISKFMLDITKETDFVYLTKSSKEWRIVFIELEHPNKSIFTKNKQRPTLSAEFNAAYQQVLSWKEFLDEHKDEVLRKVNPLKSALQENPTSFKYVLVIGRTPQGDFSKEQKKRLLTMQGQDIEILTYDSIINNYEFRILSGGLLTPFPKNILSQSQDKFAFKYMHEIPYMVFCWHKSRDFLIDNYQREYLKSQKIDIDKWEEGYELDLHGKYYDSEEDRWKDFFDNF